MKWKIEVSSIVVLSKIKVLELGKEQGFPKLSPCYITN